jgi:hypothetical protein
MYSPELLGLEVFVFLKALYDTTDQHIYKELTKDQETNTFLKE